MQKHPTMPSVCRNNSSGLNLGIDRALLEINVTEGLVGKLSFAAQSTECYECPPMELCRLDHSSTFLLVNSTFATRLFACRANSSVPEPFDVLCSSTYHFGEHGRYRMNIEVDAATCEVTQIQPPVNSNLPILYSALVYLALALFYWAARLGKRKWDAYQRSREDFDVLDEEEEEEVTVTPTSAKLRLKFLDVFRGLCIAIMIFVNYGGGKYWFFTHSAWNGLTVADLVFPWFMLIMGTSLALSFESTARRGTPRREVFAKIARRSAILFALGLLVNENTHWSTFRIPGVLQRFAVAYAAVATLKAFTAKPAQQIREQASQSPHFFRRHLPELWAYGAEWLLAVALVAAQLCLTFLLPVPGCPTGYLGPGGLGDWGRFGNCTGGAAAFIDRSVFGAKHIYQRPTSRWLYGGDAPHDPEGLLGGLNSVLIVFFGLQAGYTLLLHPSPSARVKRFAAWAVVYDVPAIVLTNGARQNDAWIPVNKNLWSLSFVLSLASMANLLLPLLYLLVDVWKLWDGAPFYFVGMNSILLYCGHELLGGLIPFGWRGGPQSHAAELAQDLWGTSLWVLIAWWLHSWRFYLAI